MCEAYDYLSAKPNLTTADLQTLQTSTFYGKEKKSLAYVIAIMNLILHGIEAPNIQHTNTLAENLADVQDKDRFEIILANPPFGGKERPEVQQNIPIRTGETAFLFMQHFIKMLRAGGRAAVVIKNTFLSNSDNASVALRKLLLESCNLHTVLDCPGGTFQCAGVKTVVLFLKNAPPPARFGTTSSTQAATWARPTRSTMRTWRSLWRCKTRLLIPTKAGAWTLRVLMPLRLICRSRTPKAQKLSFTAARRRSWMRSRRRMRRPPGYWRRFGSCCDCYCIDSWLRMFYGG